MKIIGHKNDLQSEGKGILFAQGKNMQIYVPALTVSCVNLE